ncbi:hypothetical protein 16Q_116 [Pseudomonas phage 16Q]|nr:hypothetical protein 16Q_116 [Pseudomonas phage 16Q]
MRYVSKQFLSPAAHETGSIVCTVETPRIKDMSDWGSGAKPSLHASVGFRACYGEPVSLEFNCESQRAFEKRQDKLNLMIDELTKMRDQMTEMWYSHLRDVEFKNKQSEE